ncbi:lipopolysaccharide assembly protein LapA domain-containing protein [Modestobacter marinus]|uniref:lipopolysaccharide assembly protein LapA domain-containing protein n=1 Tax=Modestobacter marinus TaxID=477641 RepID=UPI00201B196F|nr:LapA family protein [Modestobacter marinus]
MTGSSTRRTADGSTSRGPVRPAWVLAAVLALLTVVFIAQNRDRVSIHLFTATVPAPLWLLLTITVLVGAAVGALVRTRR